MFIPGHLLLSRRSNFSGSPVAGIGSRCLDVRFGSLADIRPVRFMSAFPPIADIRQCGVHVRFVPEADITARDERP